MTPPWKLGSVRGARVPTTTFAVGETCASGEALTGLLAVEPHAVSRLTTGSIRAAAIADRPLTRLGVPMRNAAASIAEGTPRRHDPEFHFLVACQRGE